MTAAALVVSLTLTSGCATYHQSTAAARAGGYTMLASIPIAIGVGAAVKEASNEGGYGAAMWGAATLMGVLAIGAVLAGSGLIGMVAHDKPPSEAERRQAEAKAEHDAVVRKQEAWALTTTASTAARSGDCDTVRTLDPQVHAVDSTFHATVFLADVGIKRCLEPVKTAPPSDAVRP